LRFRGECEEEDRRWNNLNSVWMLFGERNEKKEVKVLV
jgi:hypothetical protein